MAGDQDVMGADQPALSFELGMDLAGMRRGGLVEGQDHQAGGKPLDLAPILRRPG